MGETQLSLKTREEISMFQREKSYWHYIMAIYDS